MLQGRYARRDCLARPFHTAARFAPPQPNYAYQPQGRPTAADGLPGHVDAMTRPPCGILADHDQAIRVFSRRRICRLKFRDATPLDLFSKRPAQGSSFRRDGELRTRALLATSSAKSGNFDILMPAAELGRFLRLAGHSGGPVRAFAWETSRARCCNSNLVIFTENPTVLRLIIA